MEHISDTPLESYPELAAALGIPGLLFKREDLGRYGSHKGRSIPYMIDTYYKEGVRVFAISSSGNAAFAALKHVQTMPDITLTVFVGKHINAEKLSLLNEAASSKSTIVQTERPLQKLIEITKDGSVQSLRQSTDERALRGYESLANELQSIETDGVFIPTSSGTTAEALLTYTDLPIHIVQTSSVHPIAKACGAKEDDKDGDLADAIVDRVGNRKTSIADKITKRHGAAWIVSNGLIRAAQDLIETHTDLTLSPNSALGVAGIMQAKTNGWDPKRPIIAIITGR